MLVRASEVTAQELGPGASRKVLTYSPNLMVCQVSLAKGAVVPEHRHRHEQSTYVVSGRCVASTPDKSWELGPGDNVIFPWDVPHKVEALEDSVVLDIFSPMRQDFVGR